MPTESDARLEHLADAQPAGQQPPLPARTASHRDESLDIAKGFGIILVVLGHVLDGLVASNFFPASLLWAGLAIYVIYTFHMPLFFVVSGHLASGKLRPAKATIARLIPTIVYPYLFWSVLEGLVQMYLNKYNTTSAQVSLVWRILYIPVVPYWFLYALFLCHVLYLAVRRFSHRIQLAIAATLFILPLFFLNALADHALQIVLQTVRGFLYFILGVVTVALVKRLGTRSGLIATACFVLLATLFHLSHLGGAPGTIAVVPVALAGIMATLAWSRVLAAHPGRLVNALAFLGRYSMSIYVMHIFFTSAIRIALKRLAAHPTLVATTIEIVAATVLGTALPLAINWIISRFNLDKWFGLQHMESASAP
jgi:fucose 4-O-acetylase-like acetyltransferase